MGMFNPNNLNRVGIGIAGVARAGKNTFAKVLAKELLSRQKEILPVDMTDKEFLREYAFATELKNDLEQMLAKKYKYPITELQRVSFFDQSDEIKKITRPCMLAWGSDLMRVISKGQIWWKTLAQQVAKESPVVAIVTDFRFMEYEEDEHTFFRKCFMIPVTIHVARKTITNELVPPANLFEANNDAKIHDFCDFQFIFDSMETSGENAVNIQMEEGARQVVNYVTKAKENTK